MRYKAKIGDEFHVTKELITARTKHLTELTRSTIALSIVVVCMLALLAAACIGVVNGDFGHLQLLWGIVAAPLGWIVCYYFRGSLLDGEENDKSAA